MMIDLSDKIALVTGGARGIGRGISLVLGEQGANVAVADINTQGASDVASDVSTRGVRSAAFEVDVTDRGSVDHMVAQVIDGFGRIDILVNDAGIIGASQWWEREEPSEDDWSQVFAVNVRGVVMVSEAVSRHMRERRYGKIINIASIAARQGSPDIPHYSTTKAAVMSWTQSHALQMAPYSVNVNAICPGLLWTPMWEAIARMRARRRAGDVAVEGLSGRELFERAVEKTVPMGREQTPDDIGRLAAFLASDDAGNITGQAINVDGGLRMN
jgi:meso-butanediol dehydrogenase/(S,S)-butanediol dehydrogenase/diacetyl reductase